MSKSRGLVELIPMGLWFYWLLFLFGLFVLFFLEFGYLYRVELSGFVGVDLFVFDVGLREGIFYWVFSGLFICVSFVSFLNYRLSCRFGGNSVVWFLAGIATIFMSMNVYVPCHILLRDILVSCSGTVIYGNGNIWWLSIYAFLFCLISTRLFWEMRYYAPSLGLFLLSVAGGAVALLIRFGVLPILIEPKFSTAAQEGIRMLSAILLLMSFALFARRQALKDPETAATWLKETWQLNLPQNNPNKPTTTTQTKTPEQKTQPQTEPQLPPIIKITENIKPPEKQHDTTTPDKINNDQNQINIPRPIVQK